MESAGFPDPRLFAAAALALAVLVLGAPLALRLPTALASTTFLLTLGRLRDLGEVSTLSKASAGVALVLVAGTAVTAPGRKGALSPLSWLHPATAVFAMFCVAAAADRTVALSVRVQWLAMVLAAMSVARTVVDHASLVRVVGGLYAGLAAATLVVAAPLAADPVGAFSGGFGRFSPYGCNPNQIATMLALTGVFSLYFGLRARGATTRWISLAIGGMSTAALVLTVSRTGMAVLALGSIPSLMMVWRRPVVLLGLVALSAVAVGQAWSATQGDATFDHLQAEGKESRWTYALDVFELVGERPLLGLLMTDGAYVYDGDTNAHNAYVEMLYLGGVAYAAPIALLILAGLPTAWAWVRAPRRSAAVDPLLTQTVGLLYLATLASGLVNGATQYPTYSWAFVHLLGCHLALRPAPPQRVAITTPQPATRNPSTLRRHAAA